VPPLIEWSRKWPFKYRRGVACRSNFWTTVTKIGGFRERLARFCTAKLSYGSYTNFRGLHPISISKLRQPSFIETTTILHSSTINKIFVEKYIKALYKAGYICLINAMRKRRKSTYFMYCVLLKLISRGEDRRGWIRGETPGTHFILKGSFIFLGWGGGGGAGRAC
jgi:hypothetical protein